MVVRLRNAVTPAQMHAGIQGVAINTPTVGNGAVISAGQGAATMTGSTVALAATGIVMLAVVGALAYVLKPLYRPQGNNIQRSGPRKNS